jgi:two-component system NarL family response regulator
MMDRSPRVLRIALVDDHAVVREGTASLLAAQPDLDVVATGGNVEAAAELLRRRDIDVLVLDIRLGGSSALESMAAAPTPRPAVVILTAFDIPQYADAALRLGASGYVLKTAPTEELVAAIRRVADGGLAFSIRPSARVSLSQRERQVVALVVAGRSNDEIAAELGIAAKTVETHLRRLFMRLGLASRTELATRALREGWLDLPTA